MGVCVIWEFVGGGERDEGCRLTEGRRGWQIVWILRIVFVAKIN